MDVRGKIIEIAGKEVGYKEKKNSNSLDSKTANAGKNNYSKYGKWYGLISGAWCAMFICWVYNQAGVLNKIKKTASAPNMMKYFKEKNLFIKRGAKLPSKADVIFINWDGRTSADHVGIVKKTDKTYVYTIEGNNGNAVKNIKYKLTDKRIIGYGTPQFDNEEVGYSKGKYIVVVEKYLHVRTGPGLTYCIKNFCELTSNAKSQILKLNNNKQVNGLVTNVSCDVSQVKNKVWGKIPSGWINLEYTKKN